MWVVAVSDRPRCRLVFGDLMTLSLILLILVASDGFTPV